MQPTAVRSGPTAPAVLQRAADADAPFPLVLLDGMMPEMDGFAVAAHIKQEPSLSGATIMMLSSIDQPDDLAQCQALGIATYVRKPIKQSELLNAIRVALGRVPTGEGALVQRLQPLLPAPPRRLHILLAEDNEVNQRLAIALLEERGHTVGVAKNGHEALAIMEQEVFDCALMDVQMPEMDGLQATAAIRAREQATHTHIPIIVMTAHAFKGDRARWGGDGASQGTCRTVFTTDSRVALRSVRGHSAAQQRRTRACGAHAEGVRRHLRGADCL